jgi:cell division protein FtsN
MKWLFLILLVVNIGVFMVVFPHQQEQEGTTQLPDVGGLELAREKAAVVAAPDIEESAVGEPVSEVPEPAIQPSVVSLEASEPDTRPAQETLPVPPPESVAEQTPNGEQESVKEIPTCAIIGYVEARNDAEQISVRLRALGIKPELQSESRNEQAGFWVLIPPQKSRRDAIKIAKRLEKSGVKDLWRFTSGELAHAISLGLFRDEARAEARRREIEAMGFESIVRPRYRESTRYWLSYQVLGKDLISQGEWQGLVNDYPELVSEQIDCP